MKGDGKRLRKAVKHCLPEDPSLKASSPLGSPMMTAQPWLTCSECPDDPILAFFWWGTPDQRGDDGQSHGGCFTGPLNHLIQIEVAF